MNDRSPRKELPAVLERLIDVEEAKRALLEVKTTGGSIALGDLKKQLARLQEHKRKQAEDIMTLGQMVGKLEGDIDRLQEALVEIARFSDAEWVRRRANRALEEAAR